MSDNKNAPKGIDWSTVEAARLGIDNHFKHLHEEQKAGKRTLAEIKAQADKAAQDLRAMDQRLAQMATQASQRSDDGTAAELKRFAHKGTDGNTESVQLFRTKNARYRGVDVGPSNGLLDCDDTFGEWHRDVKDAWEAMSIAVASKRRANDDPRDPYVWRQHAPKALARLCRGLERAPAGLSGVLRTQVDKLWESTGQRGAVHRIMNGTDGTGGDFIPDEVRLPQLERDLKYSNYGLSCQNFATRTATNQNLRLPFIGTGLIPYLYGYGTSDNPPAFTASTPSTATREINPVGMAVRVAMDRDALEDSIIDSLPVMRQMMARAIMLGKEDAVINGDSAATHGDTGLANWNSGGLWADSGMGGSGDHRRAYLGLRHRALDIGSAATSDLSSGGTSYANLRALAAKMSPPHGVEGDLMLIAGYEVYLSNLLGIDEVTTLEKYGNGATILTGEVARIGPWAVVRSPVLQTDLNASGIYDNTTTTKNGIIGVNRARYELWERAGVVVELDTEIINNVLHIVARYRHVLFTPDHGSTVDSSSIRNVVYGYNF